VFLTDIKKYKKKIAIYLNKNNSITYSEAFKLSDSFLKYIKKRELIILIAENNIETLIGYIALMRSDSAIMIIDPTIKREDFKEILEKFSPSYIYCSKQLGKIILNSNFSLIFSYQNFNLLKNTKNKKYKIHNDIKILLSTSGSLGEPKFVKLSSRNLECNTKSIITYLNLRSFDRTITTMPMSYSYGLSIINTHLFSGASIVLNNNSLISRKFWDLYKDSRPSNINGVSFFYDILLKVGFNRILNPNLNFMTQAGGKLDEKIFKKILRHSIKNNIDFFLMYGQTEASPRISFHKLKKDNLNFKLAPIGQAIPGGKILLKNEKNITIHKKNIEGEVCFKGPNIFKGYSKNYKDLGKTKSLKELKTGDIAYRDKNNILFITGRKARFIKSFGYRINLDFVEEKFANKGFKVACVGIKDKIYIFSKKKFLKINQIINLPKNSFEIINLKKFPLNNNDKISYNELKKKYLKAF